MTADPAAEPAGPVADVRVVVVTYSPGEVLDRFLETLADATSRRLVVVMADNGSTDGAPERAAADGRAELLRTGGNLGYGAAANAGARGREPWLVVANPDVAWEPGSLDALLEAAERWPRGGAFGPLMRTPEGEVYPSARELPSLGRGAGHALLGWWWPGNPFTRAYRREDAAPSEREAGWLSGACLLLRRTAFEQVGGFDPAYFMFFEDVDLGERLGAAGWRSVWVPSAEVVHVGGHSWRDQPHIMVKAHHASAYRYLSRQHPGPLRAPLRFVLGGALYARYLLSRVVGAVGRGAPPHPPREGGSAAR